MADKTKRHEVVDFINRREGFVLPECKSHDKTLCEMYCNDCDEPTCVLCVTTTHKKHDMNDIKSILEKFKKRIIDDIEELENTIRPKFQTVPGEVPSQAEFDKVMNAIQDQEDRICKVVRLVGRELKDEVVKRKREFEQKYKEAESSAAMMVKKLNVVIQNNKNILDSNDAEKIFMYRSKNTIFKNGSKQTHIQCPIFFEGKVSRTQLKKLFGSINTESIIAPKGTRGLQNLMTNPVVLSSVQTSYGNKSALWRVLCEKRGKIWISGNDRKIYKIDQSGLVLKTIKVSSNAFVLSLSVEQELVFSVWWPDTKVYRYEVDAVKTVVDLFQWCPRGLCHSANGDLMVSMRSMDMAQSKVVRYTGTKDTMVIQYDSYGKPLFSVGAQYALLLTENGNGDICVADHAGESVTVVDAAGQLRFKYQGNVSSKAEYRAFNPLRIATDIFQQILIGDFSNDFLHLIDRDGNLVSYIEYPSNGGLSIDTDNNLLAADSRNGIIQVIKYIQ